MRKLIVILLLASCFTGCGSVSYEEPSPIDGLPSYETYDELELWINRNIKYTTDEVQYGYLDYWATPEETLQSRKGDCEDMALLFLYTVYQKEDFKGKFRYYYPKEKGSPGHATAIIGDFEFGFIPGFTKYPDMSYDLAMYRTGSIWATKGLEGDNHEYYSD
jgi:hypothetical protein